MSRSNKDSKLLIYLIGGALGIGALTIFLSARKEKAPLNTIGETIVRVGQILGDHKIDEPAAIRRAEKSIHSHESVIGETVEWLALGLSLWKKFTK